MDIDDIKDNRFFRITLFDLIRNEKKYKKLFKSAKRFSTLVSLITIILESERTDEEKLELFTYMNRIATESLCRICMLDNQAELPSFSDGLCRKHYSQRRLSLQGTKINKENLPLPKSRLIYSQTCSIPGCDRKHFSRGYCSLHYSRVYNSGIDPTDLEAMNQPPRNIKKSIQNNNNNKRE